jgi:hypothetical protein
MRLAHCAARERDGACDARRAGGTAVAELRGNPLSLRRAIMSNDRFRDVRALLAALAPLGLLTAGCGSSLGDFTGRVCLPGQGGLSDLTPIYRV